MRRAVLLAFLLNFCLYAVLLFPQPLRISLSAHAATAATPGDVYNESPTSHTLAPTAIYTTSGTVTNPTNLLSGQSTRLSGNGSYVVVDFGKEVGGIVTLTFAGSSDNSQSIGLAFSESSTNIGPNSDASNGGGGADEAIYASVTGAGSYTMPSDKLRGGFRYLTLFLNSSGWVDINGVSLHFTAEPAMSNPAAYPDYFYSNDSLLNKIWYAGAYTVQLDTLDPTQGRVWPAPSSGWENNGVIGVGSEVLTDGAKRDRTVWPGDMGVSLPTEYVSTDDLVATRNSLTTLYQHQNTSTGELPYAGPEFNFAGSDTYHMWTLIGTASYYLYSGDKSWLDGIWSQYQLGVNYSVGKIDSNGLMNVTGTNDWARNDQGGENIEANALLYHVLTTGATLAQVEGNTSLASSYSSKAASLKAQINALLWDSSAGAYKDNPGSTLHPQDGNSLAVWYNVVSSNAQAQTIVNTLHNNWNNLGAITPEWNSNISPFAGSMELFAHFTANDDASAIALIKREWGYMLNASIGTGSTFWEGYTASGAFGYGSSYTSLAHGWSTGPTSALTQYVLGIAPTSAAGQSYQVIPHPANLTHVEGTLTVATGKTVHVSYDHGTSGTFSMQVDTSTNSGSTGVIAVPRFGQSHTVTINGATAWNGSAFVGANGIASADQDTNYIYFRGVQPGTYTFSYPSTNTTYQPLPGTWTQCAAENATCSFNGAMTVAYGASGTYTYATETNSVSCNNSVFGDPIYGTAKACYIEPPPPTANTWIQCAAENAPCSFSGTMTVAFGANGSYNYATETNGTNCADSVFGDPLYNTVKACYLIAPPSDTAIWNACSAENGACSFVGTHEVAYGANGKYSYGSFTNGTPCNNSIFGDPNQNVVKSCYYQ
jgi:hypothetical protein